MHSLARLTGFVSVLPERRGAVAGLGLRERAANAWDSAQVVEIERQLDSARDAEVRAISHTITAIRGKLGVQVPPADVRFNEDRQAVACVDGWIFWGAPRGTNGRADHELLVLSVRGEWLPVYSLADLGAVAERNELEYVG